MTKTVIQGDPNDAVAIGLYTAALQALTYSVLVRWATPGEYPVWDEAAAYVCHDRRCSRPVLHSPGIKAAISALVGS